jgi:hypothetical protein
LVPEWPAFGGFVAAWPFCSPWALWSPLCPVVVCGETPLPWSFGPRCGAGGFDVRGGDEGVVVGSAVGSPSDGCGAVWGGAGVCAVAVGEGGAVEDRTGAG